MENELEPRLRQMLNSYGITPERNSDAARRNQERFVEILNIIIEEPLTTKPSTGRPSLRAWTTSLRQIFASSIGRRSLLAGFAVLIVLAMFLFGGMGITAYAASSSLPGDALYSLKTTVENVRARLTPDLAARARLYTEFAGRRLLEMRTLVDEGRYEDLPRAANEFEGDLQKALNAIESLSQTDPGRAAELNAEIAVALRIYGDILNTMLAVIPSEMQPAIQKALNASQSAGRTLGGSDDDGIHDDDSFDDEDDPTPTLAPSQTPLVTGTTDPSLGASETPQMTATLELVPTASEPPPATLTAVPTSIPTSDGGSSVVPGADGTCQGFLGAVTVENLEVPQGASCTLDGTRVQGNIFVRNGASLTAQRVTVIGNIQAEGARLIEVLASSTVGGSIQLKQGGSARVESVIVTGDIQFESNNGVLSAANNQVGGNIQVFQNAGGVTIANNFVNGNLQCKENSPAPGGGNNSVQGNKEDQCAGL
jgi:hypothetical protein